jgi:hypothetical protein
MLLKSLKYAFICIKKKKKKKKKNDQIVQKIKRVHRI